MKYFEKLADMIMGPPNGKGDIISGGIYIGTDSDHKKKQETLQKLLMTHKSLKKTKEEYQKLYPKDFTTLAFRKMQKPGLLSGDKKFYADRVKNPRVFLRIGRAGGDEQRFFYKEVARAKYDSELDKKEPIYL